MAARPPLPGGPRVGCSLRQGCSTGNRSVLHCGFVLVWESGIREVGFTWAQGLGSNCSILEAGCRDVGIISTRVRALELQDLIDFVSFFAVRLFVLKIWRAGSGCMSGFVRLKKMLQIVWNVTVYKVWRLGVTSTLSRPHTCRPIHCLSEQGF